MAKTIINIEDFLTDESWLAITGTSIFGDGDSFTLADHTAVYNELLYKYGGRSIIVREGQTAAGVFEALFKGWKDRRKNDIASILNAWQMKYNPIENYDATETKTGTETGLETPTNRKKTVTQTPTGWTQTETQTPTGWKEKQTPNGWKEKQTPTNWKETVEEGKQTGENAPNYAGNNASKVVAFGATDPLLISENTTDISTKKETSQAGTFETERLGTFETERLGTYQTQTTHTGIYTTEDALSGTLENKMTYDTTLNRHGNIGIASAPDLLMKDLQARCIDFVDKFIFEFITEYTFYI